MHCAWHGDYHSLSLTRIQFQPPKGAPLTKRDEVWAQGLCYCNSNAWGWQNSYQSGVIGITDQLIFQNGKKPWGVREEQQRAKDTMLTSLLRQPSTITCWDRFDRNCQYRQHRTELIKNSLMIEAIKGCAEINLHDPSLLQTPQCTFQCMGHANKRITGTQTFPISKLGGWKHTTFHKSFETNRHQTLKHHWQHWC